MSSRLLVPLGALVVAGTLAAILVVAAPRHQPSGAARADALQGPLMPAAAHAPAIALRDQDGRPARLADYRGRVVMLTFLHSLCRGACPVVAQQIRAALDDLGPQARRVAALAVSVDPPQDTPANARHFLRVQGMTGRLRFLLGSRSRLAAVWRAYGIRPVGSRLGHSVFLYLVDPSGVLRVGYPANDIVPEEMAHDVRVLLRG